MTITAATIILLAMASMTIITMTMILMIITKTIDLTQHTTVEPLSGTTVTTAILGVITILQVMVLLIAIEAHRMEIRRENIETARGGVSVGARGHIVLAAIAAHAASQIGIMHGRMISIETPMRKCRVIARLSANINPRHDWGQPRTSA